MCTAIRGGHAFQVSPATRGGHQLSKRAMPPKVGTRFPIERCYQGEHALSNGCFYQRWAHAFQLSTATRVGHELSKWALLPEVSIGAF